MSWIKDPNSPATNGQKYLIDIMAKKIPKLRIVKKGKVKIIGELTKKEADQVIKKLSLLKSKK